jgi:hypothetical protein
MAWFEPVQLLAGSIRERTPEKLEFGEYQIVNPSGSIEVIRIGDGYSERPKFKRIVINWLSHSFRIAET